MTRHNLGLGLVVALVAILAASGVVAAHGGPGPDAGDPDGSWWMGTHMAGDAGPMGYAADTCHGSWTAGMMGGAGGWGMGGSGLWGLGFLWPLLVIGLVVGLGYVLLTRTDVRREDRALQVLRERYATGELSADEYAARLGTLED